MACFPLAQQFKVPYFGGGAMTAGFTGKMLFLTIFVFILMQRCKR